MSLLLKDFRPVIGRKRHRCEACFGPIAAGEFHYQVNPMYEINEENWRLHEKCFERFEANGYAPESDGSLEVPERALRGVAPREGQIVLVPGGVAQYRGGIFYTGMEIPQYTVPIQWQVNWWFPLNQKPSNAVDLCP